MEDKAKKYRLLLNQYLESVNVVMSKLYDDMEFQLITAVSSFPLSQLEKGFPITLQKRINTIINKLNKKSTKVIAAGARTSWTLSNTKNDEFVNNYFKNKQKPANWQQKYCKANEGALNAFLKRKTNGLDLSERVWNYNGQYIDELETALQIAIGNGVPANELSKYLTKYLNNTSATILAVDKNGISKKQPIKPGRGVYREPKKNAMRLARTEINMSYDTADWTRYQQLDFVVGFEVHLSGNHTVKRGKRYVKLIDICDRLAGKYPKSFKFTGWHPNCRCYVTSILKSQEEQDKEDLARLRGETPDEQPSENIVTEPPKGFEQWVKENTKSLQQSHSLPYFVRDNQQYFNDISFAPKVEKQFDEVNAQLTKEQHRALILQQAKERQAARTIQQIEDIKTRWQTRDVPIPEVQQQFKKNQELTNAFTAINKKEQWFVRGVKELTTTNKKNINGSTDSNGTIRLKSERLNNCKSALTKIGERRSKDITKDEADSMAILWHEITHNRNIPGAMKKTAKERLMNEMMTEFVARKTLADFYKSLGVRKMPYVEFVTNRDSTGYNVMVKRFDYLIEVFKLDVNKVIKSALKHYCENTHVKQPLTAQQALLDGGLDKFTRIDGKPISDSQIKHLILMCRDEQSERNIIEYMKQQKIIH